jgi:short-subunit dehydrogenase
MNAAGGASMEKETRPLVVVVTGASAGVGRATAKEYAKRGANIGLIARGPEGLEAVQEEVELAGGKGMVLPLDVTDADRLEAAAARVEDEFGPIDIWVNCAVSTIFAPFKDISPEEYRRVTEVNYHGVVYGTMTAIRRMLPRDYGTIVQVGSALAHRAIPLQSAYCGAEFAIRGFTESLRTELINNHSQVHLTMVQLPSLNTPQFNWCKTTLPLNPRPIPPVYQPEVAARAILWAADNRKREVTVGSASLGAIWLNKFFPGWVDRFFASTAYPAQQTDDPVDPDRMDNLFSPVHGDPGTHGAFDREARSHSLQFWANTHQRELLLAGLLLAGTVVGGLLIKRLQAGKEEKEAVAPAAGSPEE